MKLGILSQDVRLYSTSRLLETAKNRGHETEVISYLRCYMNIAKAKPRIFFQGREINFDVAILGCGAYAFPLAGMLKDDGKVVVNLGGATQLLFGIKGKRWDDLNIYNESWKRPYIHERCDAYDKVENGCYY